MASDLELLDFGRDIPTTDKDVEVLRHLRETPVAGLLEHPELLELPDWLAPRQGDTRTSAGWVPFEL
jgi:hypothetical protein